MNDLNKHTILSPILINWYNANKRDLPWRDITDPYKIWISEIILQQTRVNQGMSYYLRFIERFPTVEHLALSHEDEVLKYWQGLGYYSRARNLHKAARQVMAGFNGKFPQDHAAILRLAGIGEYTAAAICSFAFDQPYAVVDGNVYRVLSRVFGMSEAIDSGKGKKLFAGLARDVLPGQEPGLHNQAIMEFGALQCVPVSPRCDICPLKGMCTAYKLDLIQALPVKAQKTKVSSRFFNYFFIRHNNDTFLQKRNAKDVWQNLYEFPLIETTGAATLPLLLESSEFSNMFGELEGLEVLQTTNPMKHVLSHRVIYAQFVTIRVAETNVLPEEFIRVPLKEIDHYPVSRLMELFLEKTGDLFIS